LKFCPCQPYGNGEHIPYTTVQFDIHTRLLSEAGYFQIRQHHSGMLQSAPCGDDGLFRGSLLEIPESVIFDLKDPAFITMQAIYYPISGSASYCSPIANQP
jgi:hypothetical protein